MPGPSRIARAGSRPPSSHRSVRRPLAAAAVAGVVLVAVGLVLYRGRYDVWPWATYPTTLRVCDRDYQLNAGSETRAQITAQGYHLVRHGTVPGPVNRGPLWTYDAVNGQATESLPGGCQVVMWVQGGPDTFGTYALEGGP